VRGFTFEIVWADEDILEVRLQAASEAFSGLIHCYAGLGEAARLAERLAGFPRDLVDMRNYELGADSPTMLVAGASIKLKCADSSGHVSVAVDLWAKNDGGERENVCVSFRTVPAEIDVFVADLRGMGNQAGAVAQLREAI
jgi:hypothetical protein